MIDFDPTEIGAPIILPSEHGDLHGSLILQPDSPGLVVLAHAALALDGRDALMAGCLRQAGFSTLSADLLTHKEEQFPDTHNNVPLLARRLLGFLEQIRHRMRMVEIPNLSLALCAANDTTPVVVRIAAQRDHDIAAIVCRGGLIDRAGMLYLRTLASPLLLLHEHSDEHHMSSNRRALQEIPCATELQAIPDFGFEYATSVGFEIAARETIRWFTAALRKH